MKWLKLTLARFKSNTPEYFVKLRNFAIAIGTAAISVHFAYEAFDLNINEVTIQICDYIIAACFALGLGSQLTTTNKNLSEL